jgi:hypothetical protein
MGANCERCQCDVHLRVPRAFRPVAAIPRDFTDGLLDSPVIGTKTILIPTMPVVTTIYGALPARSSASQAPINLR